MLTEYTIEQQITLEREAIRHGKQRFHKQTHSVEDKEYASASVYGSASIDCLLPRLTEYIESTTKQKVKEGKNGRAFAEISTYLDGIEASVCALIALKITFDKVFSFREDASNLVNVCDAIGIAVEQECQMRYYEREAPGLLHILKENYWHTACGTHQKFVNIRLMMNRNNITWDKWSRDVRVKLGGWLLECVINTSGWFEDLVMRTGKKTETCVVPSASFMDIKDQLLREAEALSAYNWPMLVPPREWTNEAPGGYLLDEVMLGHDLVRGDGHRIQGETPLEFLNELQATAYQINPFVYSVARALSDKGYAVGKFLPIIDHPLPSKPVDIATNKDARQSYRRECAQVRNRIAAEFRKSCRTRMTMDTAERFIDKKEFYLPWSFDYRGRAYPIPAFLTPHDTDFGKSLIRFAYPTPLTESGEDWLAFQVATTYGKDKDTIKERLAWVKDNFTFISSVAQDPIGNLSLWEGVSEPWLFLAACDEYYHCCISRERSLTCLPVYVDATCSGLQILAGLARDASTARLVNVLPSSCPQDAYKTVADVARPKVPESIREELDRKVVKRVVMTVPYNAKPHSNRGYIRDALKEKGIEIDKDDLTTTVKAVRDAMDEIVPGPMKVMKWIESVVSEVIKGGAEEICWTTPSGFEVTQRLMKKETEVINLQLLGSRKRVKVSTGDSDKVDLLHHKNATAPNLIHSVDASLLHMAITGFQYPVSVIHDSVLCRASDMDKLSDIVRQTYMWLFTNHDILKDWAEDIGSDSEPPIIGDLEPSSVIESTYFFC